MIPPSNLMDLTRSSFGTTGASTAPEGFWNWGNILGNDKQAGVLPVMANVGSGLMQGWAGLGQLKLAKQQQKFNEGMSRVNLANQATLTNQQLQSHQAMLHKTNPSLYESPETFMQKWQVKGTI
jgi:hypothetical protein